MPYFAYGSNLNAADLTAWCKRQRLMYPLGAEVGPAWLPDYQLVFDTYSSARQGGVANVIPRKGYAVPGMIYKVRRGGWRVLNIKEGAPYFYQKKEITVLPHTGDTAQCMTYLLEPSETYIPPTVRYVMAIAEGCALHQLPVEPLLASAQDKDAPLMAFVYGTLKRGGRLHENMSGFEFAGEATVPGRLVNCGWYPGLVEGDAGEVVHGELYRAKDSRDTEDLVTRLDRIEGFTGYGQPNLYDRRILTATDAAGRTHPCWAYWWMGSRELPKVNEGVWL